jgi:ribosomal protein S18 acetylase RimI-like enzyme
MKIVRMRQPEELDRFFHSLRQESMESESSIRQVKSLFNTIKVEGYTAMEDDTAVSVILFSREKSTILCCFVLPQYENKGIERELVRKAVTELKEGGAKRITGAFVMSNPPVHIPIREELELLKFTIAEEIEMANDKLDVQPKHLPEEYSLLPYREIYRKDMIRVKYLGNKGDTGNPLVRGVTSMEETEEEARKALSGQYGTFLPQPSLMLFHGDDAVGCITCVRRPDGVGIITNVTVVPEYRNRGLGKILVAAALTTLKRLGIFRVQLSVVTSTVAAVKIYEGLGFKEIARVCYYSWEDSSS